MTSNISSMLQFWKTFNLPQLQRDLDVNATELANRQDASDASRRKLVEQSKEFKKSTPEDVRKSVAPLLRSFQTEIDALSKRSKACEADFLNLYKKLVELPDPVIALEQAEVFQRKTQRLNDVETENQKLRETLAEYNKEFAEVKNQEVTIKTLRERLREYEKNTESRAKQMTLEMSDQLEKRFAEKEKTLQETQLLIATKLGEAEQTASTLKAALDSSQAELFDIKSKYDEDLAAKQAELDILLGDVDKSMQRASTAEKELEQLKEHMEQDSVSTHDRKKSASAMEEAIEVLSRSSLESELTSKEKEIGQLVEDIQHLQGSMAKLRESSAGVIAKLEEELGQKNALCQDLQNRMEERQDYNEIKRELQIIKSTEFSTLDASANQDGKQDPSQAGSVNSKSLELLLLEKNRAQQSENTALRASNAQLTDGVRRVDPLSNSPGTSSVTYRSREEIGARSSNRTPENPVPNAFSTPDYTAILKSSEALNQLQLQKQQQIQALLYLKILASIKAAVDAQNINIPHLSSIFPNPARPPPGLIPRYSSSSISPPRSSASSPTATLDPNSNNLLSNCLAQIQKSLRMTKQPGSASGSGQPEHSRRSELSDNSDDESFYDAGIKSHRRRLYDERNRSSELPRARMRVSVDADHVYSPFVDRNRRYSSGADNRFMEQVDTEELTSQVKDILQANNIGQRAFGQYVLGLSQGSVSEILSKPKPWSKLTFKGKEPFYKMMDFVSSPRNVEGLKSLQRKDREDRVLCSSRPHTLRQADSESDQAIANILAAAKEEMRREQEKLKRAQKLYDFRNYNAVQSGRTPVKSRDSSLGESFIELSRPSSQLMRKRRTSLEQRESMTMMATGPYSHSYAALSKENSTMSPFSTALDTAAANGAMESSVETSLPSLINRQISVAFTGNESARLLKIHKDKQANSESPCNHTQEARPVNSVRTVKAHEVPSTYSGNIRLEVNSLDSDSGKQAQDTEGEILSKKKQSSGCDVRLVKAEPSENRELSDYFGDVRHSKGSFNKLSARQDTEYPQKLTKDDLLSSNHRIISSHENESLQRLFVTSTYNDPFIPPPLSPAADRRGSPIEQGGGTSGEKESAAQSYDSPFMDDDSVSSHFLNENSDSAPGNSFSSRKKSDQDFRDCERRKRVASLSPPSNHTEGLLSEPTLFKELNCSSFPESVRGNFATSHGASSSAPSTFSSMISNQHSSMSSLQTNSNTSYSAQASYTELNPVTTGSLYTPHRDMTIHEFHGSPNNGYSVEGSQHGIASMLPPLGMKTSHHNSNSLPTFTTLNHSVPTSRYSQHSPVDHTKHLDGNYDDMVESSNLTAPPIPPEALHKLSMSHVDTAMLTKEVRDRLAKHSICQRIFGERILGLSQGTVSDILSHPKPWGKLTHKGKEPFARMIMWLADSNAGGLLGLSSEGVNQNGENVAHSPLSDGSNSMDPVNLSKGQSSMLKNHSPTSNGTSESVGHFMSLSPVPATTLVHSPHPGVTDRGSPQETRPIHVSHAAADSGPPMMDQSGVSDPERRPLSQDPFAGGPVTPLQQMLNIQELAASCPKLDTFALTRKVKDILTEHNIGQRIFGQAVLGLTQGSVSDLLSRPKLWRSLSLKGREPFVRMQLWLSDPNNIEQLKSLKLERWMEKKWGNKRQRSSENLNQHSLSPVKKQRIVLSSEEKEVLRRAYGIEPYPSQETVDLLAIKLGRKSSTIVNWFHNYRSRVKRGFFPGEEINDGGDKKGGAKITVKQLLDTITLSGSHHQNSRNSFSTASSFSKSSLSNSQSAGRCSNSRMSEQTSWAPQQIPSPSDFEKYSSMDQMKTESLDQHFQNLQRSEAEDVYPGGISHGIKQEPKLVPVNSEPSAMYSSTYNYHTLPNSSSDIFKSAEMALGDPVAVAAASTFLPKQPHLNQYPGPALYNLDDHTDGYSLAPLSTENSYHKLSPAHSTSPQNSQSFLPPVHTLTPKKSFGSPPSLHTHVMLPSASSLLNPPPLTQPQDKHPNMGPYGSRPMHHLINLTRPPHYDTMIGNNNMNNNSGPSMVKNVTLPGGVSLTVSGSQRHSNTDGIRKSSPIPTTLWADVTAGPNVTKTTADNTQSGMNRMSPVEEGPGGHSVEDGKEDDGLSWVF